MACSIVIPLIVLAWLALIALSWCMRHAPRDEENWGLAWVTARVYSRVLHHVRLEGAEHIPTRTRGGTPAGPLIVVSNHTAGVDPVLIQAACGFEIRWMMMREMMLAPFARLWEWLEIIPVEQNGRDSTSLRTAIRHLQTGGVIGIFAEGGLERPREHVNPYLPGVGLLVLKSKARVLPVVISGAPRAESAYASLLLPSRTRLRFLPVREYAGSSLSAPEIARELELEAASALGWPRAVKETTPHPSKQV